MAREYGRHALEEPFPTCPKKGIVVVRRMMPVEFIKLDGMMNRGNERNGKQVSKHRRIKARMVMNYVEVLSNPGKAAAMVMTFPRIVSDAYSNA